MNETVTVNRSDLFVVFMLATGHKPDPEGLTPFALERIAAAVGSCSEVEVRDMAESVSDFDWFWAQYPRKVGRLVARKAWDKALKVADAGEIIAGATRLKEHWAGQPRERMTYCPHPSRWLNEGRWDEELVPHPSSTTKVQQTRENLTDAARSMEVGPSFDERMRMAGRREIGP